MKKIGVFLVLSFLAFSLAQTQSLPADERFDTPITFKTALNGESLRAVIEAIAFSVGLTPVANDVPETFVVYNFSNPTPFRQVWELILVTNDIEFLLLDNDVVVVGPPSTITKLTGEEEPVEVEATPAPVEEEPVVQRFYPVNSPAGDIAQLIQVAIPDAEVVAFESTGTVSVRGTQAEQDQALGIIADFDAEPAVEAAEEPRIQRLYRLSNADAAEVAAILQATGVLVSSETVGAQEVAEGDAVLVPTRTTEEQRDFVVVADTRTNSVIINATALAHEQFAQLIPELDFPQQQVNVQVRIQEVSTRSALDLGINLSSSLGSLAATVLDGGLNFVFDAQSALSSLNINAALDALETQGLSRRVDDSNLTMLNNASGSLQAGGTIFISLVGGSVTIEREIPYGVQIDVTPKVANDGSVVLEVEAQVEDVLSETGDPSFLELSTRRVNTTVTLEQGQTVILGGLMQNVRTETENRVPILGSIPVIGGLFGNTVISDDSTELLLIINATVIE